MTTMRLNNVVQFPIKRDISELTKQLREIIEASRDLSEKKKMIERAIYEEINEHLPNRGTYTHGDIVVRVSESHKVDSTLAARLVDDIDLPVDLFRVKYEVNQKALDDLVEYYENYIPIVAPVITTSSTKYMTVK